MADYLQLLIFYAFALLALVSSLVLILSNNPVRCALALVLTFFASAGVWILAQAEFLALVLILVYVGAVMTLFLFVIMMLNINIVTTRSRIMRSLPLGFIVVCLLALVLGVAIRPDHFNLPLLNQAEIDTLDVINVEQLGLVLYNKYAYAFEIAGALLLVSIIAAISLAHRDPRKRKVQEPRAQIQVHRDDRVRLIKMKTEKYE